MRNLSICIGIGAGRAGAPGSGSAPIIDTLAYNAGTNEISFNTDTISGTAYYELAATSTPMAAAAIEASAMGSIAVSAGTVTEIEDWSLETPGTYWLNVVHKSGGGVYSNVLNLEVEIPSFNPATLAAIFLDASDISTLWTDNAGTTQVTTTADPVGSVTNLGTLGGLMTNTGATDRPIYTESGALRYLQGDGSNDYLKWVGTNGDIDLSSGYYIIMGIHENTAGASKGFMTGASTAGNGLNDNHSFNVDSNASGTIPVVVNAGPTSVNGIQVVDSSRSNLDLAIVEYECIPAAGSTNAWLRTRYSSDGDVVERATDTATSGQHPNTATLLGQVVFFARITSGNPVNFAIARIYCAALVLGTVTAQNKTDYRAWVAGKIGF